MERSEVKPEIQEFESRAFEAFICPIRQQVMKDPYMDDNGISYQKQAICEWINKRGTHPLARRQMKLQQLKPNLMLKEAIEKCKSQYKDRIKFEMDRKRFEVNRLDFQAAARVQFEATPASQDSQIKDKERIKMLEQIIAQSKQSERKHIKSIQKLENTIFQKDQTENNLKQIIKQLNQKNRNLEIQILQMKQTLKNISVELALQKKQKQQLQGDLVLNIKSKQALQQELKRSKQALQQELKKSKQALQQELKTAKENLRVLKQSKQEVIHQITPDITTYAWEQGKYRLDSQNKNLCIYKGDGFSEWLCSSDLPSNGEFVFTIKAVNIKDIKAGKGVGVFKYIFGKNVSPIHVGIMESEAKGKKGSETVNNRVRLSVGNQQISQPNDEQTSAQLIDCQCQCLFAKQPCLIKCYVNRQLGTIVWYYNDKQQAKSKMPQSWKDGRKLCAVVYLWKNGDSVEFIREIQ